MVLLKSISALPLFDFFLIHEMSRNRIPVISGSNPSCGQAERSTKRDPTVDTDPGVDDTIAMSVVQMVVDSLSLMRTL